MSGGELVGKTVNNKEVEKAILSGLQCLTDVTHTIHSKPGTLNSLEFLAAFGRWW